MDYLHEHEFATLLVNAPWIPHEVVFDLVQSLATNVWLLAHVITLAFCLFFTHFFITIRTDLGLSQLIVAHFSHYEDTIDDLSIHLL
jgi:hypothetical protein